MLIELESIKGRQGSLPPNFKRRIKLSKYFADILVFVFTLIALSSAVFGFLRFNAFVASEMIHPKNIVEAVYPSEPLSCLLDEPALN